MDALQWLLVNQVFRSRFSCAAAVNASKTVKIIAMNINFFIDQYAAFLFNISAIAPDNGINSLSDFVRRRKYFIHPF
jgi:hypothetical protein